MIIADMADSREDQLMALFEKRRGVGWFAIQRVAAHPVIEGLKRICLCRCSRFGNRLRRNGLELGRGRRGRRGWLNGLNGWRVLSHQSETTESGQQRKQQSQCLAG